MRRTIRIYFNALRRAIINRLLGKTIVLEIDNLTGETRVQLIDMHRHINYGFWYAKVISKYKTAGQRECRLCVDLINGKD